MKFSKFSINRKTHAIPNLRFEDQKLTSFSGLTLTLHKIGELGLARSTNLF